MSMSLITLIKVLLCAYKDANKCYFLALLVSSIETPFVRIIRVLCFPLILHLFYGVLQMNNESHLRPARNGRYFYCGLLFHS